MKLYFLSFSFLLITSITYGQSEIISGQISKHDIKICWSEFNTDQEQPLMYSIVKPIEKPLSDVSAILKTATYREITSDELYLTQFWEPTDTINITPNLSIERKKTLVSLSFTPFRLNQTTNKIEILTSYSIELNGLPINLKSAKTKLTADESLLKTGNWFKIKVDTTGIFKLTFDELKAIGLSEPGNIRVYSYGGRQLSYWNKMDNFDDLNEIPIKIEKGNDGVFNGGDYILFYAQGPTTISYNKDYSTFIHSTHTYSNFIYLFLTSDLGEGLRISEKNENALTPDTTSTSFDSYRYHEQELYNLVRSGRRWYGKKIHPGEEDSVVFYFPNLMDQEKINGFVSIAGRKPANTAFPEFDFSTAGKQLVSFTITESLSVYTFGTYKESGISFLPKNGKVFIKYAFNCKNNTPEGLLDRICLTAREKLIFNQNRQLHFRDHRLMGKNVAKFVMNNRDNTFEIWDVTTPTLPVAIKTQTTGQQTSFIFKTESTIREFIAFNSSKLLTPIINGDDLGKVVNQNIHGEPTCDLVIVCPPKFRKYADELAEVHRVHDSMSVFIVSPQELYNEFSGGTPDATAIRNYMRFLYNRVDDELPKYLLLFGDGTYDNKDILKSGSNIILTYQSASAESETTSYVTDDYFGMLDQNEGENVGSLDIGIGRFPVQTDEEAEVMIQKIKHYLSTATFGDWRNQVAFIADDEDQSIHLTDADEVAQWVAANNPQFNINKIYFDAYNQVSISAGQRYPDVTKAVYQQVDRGAAIIDYVGHGNPRILSHEEILSTQDVRSWKNYDKLSVFVTASCEVGRFDDHDRTSFGEWIVLNPGGAGIVAFTTTRVVYITSNAELNQNFFMQVFNRDLHMGDIIRMAKNNTSTSTDINKRNFTLLGDPALKLVMPENKAIISKINGNPLNAINIPDENQRSILKADDSNLISLNDTIHALDTVTMEGYVVDKNGSLILQDGILYPTIYDKPLSITTNQNDANSPKETFFLQNSILYKGKAKINQGFFEFSFIVPKDINYTFGNGKISLYATFDSIDANGSCRDFMIGGTSNAEFSDNQGPQIELFMNDTSFASGNITSENPVLLALLKDESGINTTGNGIGHNITAIIDDKNDDVLILNNFYESNINQYNSGQLQYPLSGLTPGSHTIKFKAWDIYNNSSESEIAFYVNESSNLVIDNLYNYPNPFYDQTEFVFEHNQSDGSKKIKIEIFDLMGKKVAELNSTQTEKSFKISPIIWNGASTGGTKLARGMYIYKAQLTNSLGAKTSKSSKLMILK